MRSAFAVVPGLLVLAAFPLPADNLPAYCGPVGAKSYTPPVVNIPPVVLNRGTVITVTNATMVINGDTSSVKALVANPGADGISLQEAIIATNNNPGTWNIQFAPALEGSTIVVDTPPSGGLQPLSGGNVTINGDINGDGQPDITLTSQSANLTVYVISGGNTLNGLALQNCGIGGCVSLRSPSAAGGFAPGPVVTGKTFANTTLSNLVLTNMAAQGYGIQICPSCGPQTTAPTGNIWDHVLLTGNTITGTSAGPIVGIAVGVSWGATLQHTTIANNRVLLPMAGTSGISFGTGQGLGPPDQGTDILLDTLIVNNTVTAAEGIAFRGTTQGSIFDGVQLIGNQVNSSGQGGSGAVGIIFHAADPESGLGPNKVQPFNNNVMKNIAILGNAIQGNTAAIAIQPGQNAAANNSISNVAILGNTTLNTAAGQSGPANGIFLYAGRSDASAFVATGNSLSNVLIQANTIQSLVPPGDFNFGGGDFRYAIQSAGISVIGGLGAKGNSIQGISIANNDVNTPSVGIAITAGSGSGAPSFAADNNVIALPEIFCNQVDQVPTQGVLPSSGIHGINVISGLDEASGNQLQQLYIADNLIAGSLAGASTFSYVGSGGSGNSLTTASTATPAISFVANAEGESPVIAPNTWIEIKGVNLAPHADALALRTWTASDFVNGQMPVALDNVGVTVNGKNAYVFYVSPSQINVLTPPDAITGPVDIIVTNNGVVSAKYSVQSQALSPSFFVFDGAHVIGAHLDGTDIGPATLYPGLTTPAKPGETIVLFANGFGTTSTPVVTGSQSQSGTLSPLPIITIGGIQANVRFAGLNIAPGQFQFNVDVPVAIPDGDQPIVATYNGLTTQALLAVQHD